MKRVELLTDAFEEACRCLESLSGQSVRTLQIGDLGRVARVGSAEHPFAWVVEQQSDEPDRGWRVWKQVDDVPSAARQLEGEGAVVRLPPARHGTETRALMEIGGALVGFTDAEVGDSAPVVGPPWGLRIGPDDPIQQDREAWERAAALMPICRVADGPPT